MIPDKPLPRFVGPGPCGGALYQPVLVRSPTAVAGRRLRRVYSKAFRTTGAAVAVGTCPIRPGMRRRKDSMVS